MAQGNIPLWLMGNVTMTSDPLQIPRELVDTWTGLLDPEALTLYRERWRSIRTHFRESRSGRLSVYNLRLPADDVQNGIDDFLDTLHQRQAVGYKVDGSLACILKNKDTGRYRYYHSSVNNHKFTEKPVPIANGEDMDRFKQSNDVANLIEMASKNRQDSSWTLVHVTNITYYVYHIVGNYIRGGGHDVTEYTRPWGVERVPRDSRNLCFFTCLARHRGILKGRMRRGILKAKELLDEWSPGLFESGNFRGVTFRDLPKLESHFKIGIHVYTKVTYKGRTVAKLIRRQTSPGGCDVMDLDLSPDGAHFDLITDIRQYSRTFACNSCGQTFDRPSRVSKHELSCGRASEWKYVGGPFHCRPTPLEQLTEAGVDVTDLQDRFQTFRATYDFESYLTPQSDLNTPAGFKTRHIPMSVSLTSNIPGHEQVECIVSDGCPQSLIDKFLKKLWIMSEKAHELNVIKFKRVLDNIEICEKRLASEVEGTDDDDDDEDHDKQNWKKKKPLLEAKKRFNAWLRILPVVGFNSSRYDLCLIKPYIAKALAVCDPSKVEDDDQCEKFDRAEEEEEDEEYMDYCTRNGEDQLSYVVKKGNAMNCIATKKLIFLDILCYNGPGLSLNKYLQAYGNGQLGKSFFPYEYVTDLQKLNDKELPPYEAYFSSLKNGNTLEEGQGRERGEENYKALQEIWTSKGMKCLGDMLVFYNNLDVEPLLEALNHQVDIFKSMGLDLLRDAITLPGLALKYSMRNLGGMFYTFGPEQAYLHALLKSQIVGGPSIVFSRWAEAGKTTINRRRYGDEALTCQGVIGYDCNALYPHAMAHPMPTGQCWVRKSPDFVLETLDRGPRQSVVALEWLEYEEQKSGRRIQHAGNGPEVRLGMKQVKVDGFEPVAGMALEFLGCLYHGHPCMTTTDAKKKRMEMMEESMGVLQETLLENTERCLKYLRNKCGYEVKVMWECEWTRLKRYDRDVRKFMEQCNAKARHDQRLEAMRTLPLTGATEEEVKEAIYSGRLFGAAEVDLHVPMEDRERFHEIPPIFKCTNVGREDIGDLMREYCEQHDVLKEPRRMLISSYWGNKILLITPLIKWYHEQGLTITRVHTVIEWEPRTCFQDMVDDVADMRRAADKDPTQIPRGTAAKLLINSCYGKTLTDKTKFRQIRYLKGDALDKAVRSSRFSGMTPLHGGPSSEDHVAISARRHRDDETESFPLVMDMAGEGGDDDEEVDDEEEDEAVYEVSMKHRRILQDLPIQIAFFVYQYAKLKMLQFKYDFMDRYLDPRKWASLYSDTDSLYIAATALNIHELVREDSKNAFYQSFHEWFPSESCDDHRAEYVRTMCRGGVWEGEECCQARLLYDQKTPGLFKTEWNGLGMVSLCSKTYYCLADRTEGKDKLSSKGLQKASNELSYDQYKQVLLSGEASDGTNRGIRTGPGGMVYSYEQKRKSISYLYCKRKVHQNSVDTEPLDL